VASAVDMPLESWVLCRQVHGTRVSEARTIDEGRGARDQHSGLPRTDAVVTVEPGISLAVLTADCVPVILVEPGTPGLAAIHAGWRGLLSGIIVAAGERLRTLTRSTAGETLAFVGPHIGSCCMEVGEDVAGCFEEEFGPGCVSRASGSPHLDLSTAVDRQLERLGITGRNVFHAGVCTCCSDDYFSYRRDPACGRQAAMASIEAGRGHGS